MKRITGFFLLLLFFAPSPFVGDSYGQIHTNHSFSFGGQTRQYKRYVPLSYDNTKPTPLVIALHGMGDNMNNFVNIGLQYIADTATFIVVTPQALVDQLVQASAWNSGASAFGIQLSANVDDVGFLNALIDSVDAHYNIDKRRIYACGFSMGGFMSHRLACELNHRIAAIASVAGTIGTSLTCSPGRAVPVCHFHGTADGTVAYTGNSFGTDAEATVQWWATNNNCSASPTVTPLPDTNPNDGYTIEHQEWTACDVSTGVEFFKVTGADHTWLGPSNDIYYTQEIWRFFSKHLLPQSLVSVEAPSVSGFSLAPNPAASSLTVRAEGMVGTAAQLEVVNALGQRVYRAELGDTQGDILHTFSVAGLENGMYFARLVRGSEVQMKRFVVQH